MDFIRLIKSNKKFTNFFSSIAEKRKEILTAQECDLDKNFRSIVRFIDHTLLKPDLTENEIVQLCDEAIENNFYSVCVNASQIKKVKKILKNSTVKISSVISFPFGANTLASKLFEIEDALKNGADEVDVVINISSLKDEKYQIVYDELNSIQDFISENNKLVKFIIETSLLTKEEIIIISLIAKKIGVDFLKTSTGFAKYGAKLDEIKLIKSIVGNIIKIKASGGIKDFNTAVAMLKYGAERIGTSSAVKILNELKGK